MGNGEKERKMGEAVKMKCEGARFIFRGEIYVGNKRWNGKREREYYTLRVYEGMMKEKK